MIVMEEKRGGGIEEGRGGKQRLFNDGAVEGGLVRE